MDIGKRLKQLRIKNALTLADLAARSELSKGFLSQVERNLTSPSISTLQDIIEVLGISLPDFFKEDKDEQVCFGKNDYFVSQEENRIVTWLVPNATKNKIEPILLTLEKDGQSQEIKPFAGEEFAYVLQGSVLLVCEGKRYILRKGECFYLTGSSSHYIQNKFKGISKVIWLTTPPNF